MKRILSLALSMILIGSANIPTYADSLQASPATPQTVVVHSVAELSSLSDALQKGNVTVIFENGDYELPACLTLKGDNITFKSRSGNPSSVTLRGDYKLATLLDVSGKDFTLDGLSLGEANSHGLILHSESDADNPIIRNARFYDIKEQMLLCTGDTGMNYSDNGLIENCTFEYTAGAAWQAPNTGAIAAHKTRSWIVRGNHIKGIRGPSGTVCGAAITVLDASENPLIENNGISNCDNGVFLGQNTSNCYGGTVRNNMISVIQGIGIGLYNTGGAKVYANSIYSDGAAYSSIEYRFAGTQYGEIENNLCSKNITALDGASETVQSNNVSAQRFWFSNPETGDLHLAVPILSIIKRGLPIVDLTQDFDGQTRSSGACDIGADEQPLPAPNLPVTLTLQTDKTVLLGDNQDTLTFGVTGKTSDKKTIALTPDRIQCTDAVGNPIKFSDLRFRTYSAGTYIFQAWVGLVRSNTVKIVVKPENLTKMQASAIQALHWRGQTFITWSEINKIIPNDNPTARNFFDLKAAYPRKISYNIYRSTQPILKTAGLSPITRVDALSGWDQTLYGTNSATTDKPIPRYVLPNQSTPVSNGTGLYVFSPTEVEPAYYAVTAVTDGIEDTRILTSNALVVPVAETVGQGVPILQYRETPASFLYVSGATVYHYTRWEGPPNCSVSGKPMDYIVAVPPKVKSPAPVGIHLHCWGGTLDSGYGWWNDASEGAVLLSTNDDPYDWWTGYHEKIQSATPPVTQTDWQTGFVRPYTSNRLFSFLDWLKAEGPVAVDPTRTFFAGSSMGGSGSIMNAIRYGEKIAWCRSWVGVHIPSESNQASAYQLDYGPQAYGALCDNGMRAWDYYNDDWFLRQFPQKETGFITFCNAKNDTLIGWSQAVKFLTALQDTHRPHMFFWGQNGHAERSYMPLNGSEQDMPLDIRTDQSLPAFTHCSLDDNPGNGDPYLGATAGQINGYLYWETAAITDTPAKWEMTIAITDKAPKDACKVDLTPRRLQQFKPSSGSLVKWSNTDVATGKVIESGTISVNENNLVILPQITVSKTKNRITLEKQ